jgi:hypothetical protein
MAYLLQVRHFSAKQRSYILQHEYATINAILLGGVRLARNERLRPYGA